MTQFTTSKGEFTLREVEKGASKFERLKKSSAYWYEDYLGNPILLPTTKDETFICTTNDISEELADSIVDKVGNGHYQDYNGLASYWVFALRSFKSLLQKLNLSPSKNYAICKKN